MLCNLVSGYSGYLLDGVRIFDFGEPISLNTVASDGAMISEFRQHRLSELEYLSIEESRQLADHTGANQRCGAVSRQKKAGAHFPGFLDEAQIKHFDLAVQNASKANGPGAVCRA